MNLGGLVSAMTQCKQLFQQQFQQQFWEFSLHTAFPLEISFGIDCHQLLQLQVAVNVRVAHIITISPGIHPTSLKLRAN